MEIDRNDICKKEMIKKLVSVFYYFNFMTRLVNICRHDVTYCNTARKMIWLKLINKYPFTVFLRLLTTNRKFCCFSFERLESYSYVTSRIIWYLSYSD